MKMDKTRCGIVTAAAAHAGMETIRDAAAYRAGIERLGSLKN